MTGLDPLSGVEISNLDDKGRADRIQQLQSIAKRYPTLSPPEWYMHERDELTNDMFAEFRVTETPIPDGYERALAIYEARRQEHWLRYGNTRDDLLAAIKDELLGPESNLNRGRKN